MGLIIRQVKLEDAAEAAAIFNEAAQQGLTILGPFTVEEEREFIKSFLSGGRGIFYVAEIEGIVVGFQTVEPLATNTRAHDHIGITGTFVNVAYRRQGIGRQLAEATFKMAREVGYREISIYIFADNTGSILFYQNLGFHHEASILFYQNLDFYRVGTSRRHAFINREDEGVESYDLEL